MRLPLPSWHGCYSYVYLLLTLAPRSIPGKFAVERYPALKYVPRFLAPWKAQVLEQRRKDIEMYTGLMDDVKQRMAAGVLPHCFAKHLLDEQQNLGMSDLEVAYTAGSPFGAGVETVGCP